MMTAFVAAPNGSAARVCTRRPEARGRRLAAVVLVGAAAQHRVLVIK